MTSMPKNIKILHLKTLPIIFDMQPDLFARLPEHDLHLACRRMLHNISNGLLDNSIDSTGLQLR